jgi:hypothetical protein
VKKSTGNAFAKREQKLEIEQAVKLEPKVKGTALLPLVESVPSWSSRTIGAEFESATLKYSEALNDLRRQIGRLEADTVKKRTLEKSISKYGELRAKAAYLGAKLESLVADHFSHNTKFGNDNPVHAERAQGRTDALVKFILENELKGSSSYHLAQHYYRQIEDTLDRYDETFEGWANQKTMERALSTAYRALRAVPIRKYFDECKLWATPIPKIYKLHAHAINIRIAQAGLKAPRQRAQLEKDLQFVLDQGPLG